MPRPAVRAVLTFDHVVDGNGEGSKPTDWINPRNSPRRLWTEHRCAHITFSDSSTLPKARLDRTAFRRDHSLSTSFNSGAQRGGNTTLTQGRSASSWRIRAAVGQEWLSHTSTTGAVSCSPARSSRSGRFVLGDRCALGGADQTHPPVGGVDVQPPADVHPRSAPAGQGDQRARPHIQCAGCSPDAGTGPDLPNSWWSFRPGCWSVGWRRRVRC